MAKEIRTEKRTVQVEIDVPCLETTDRDPFSDLLGKQVILMCLNYFYAGKLTCANDSFLILEDSKIVYETGPWSAKQWANAEKLPIQSLRINRSHVEAWGEVTRQ